MYSLRKRLLIWATLLLLLFLGVMGVALNRTFEKSVLSNAEDALRNQILLLIANIDVVDGKLVVPPVLPEPRLGQVDSNLYAQIASHTNGKSEIVWRSASLLDKSLPKKVGLMGSFSFSSDNQTQIQKKLSDSSFPSLYSSTLGLEWETESGDLPFTVQVSEHSRAYQKRLARYQRTVGLSLLVLGAVLITLLLSLLGWALKPLKRVSSQVGEIEQGHRQRFDEDYPLEVSRLTQNLNQLLNFDEQRINRQREILGNLAHSLKTPIAVLSGLQYPQDSDAVARQQLASIQTIIDYQLHSASAVGRRRFAKPIKIDSLTQRIIDSLQKVHADKGLNCRLTVADGTQFFGDEGDWMELAGNLIDNAFKWSASEIFIEVKSTSNTSASSNRMSIQLTVEDDGTGIDVNLRQSILERGVRLDSQTPGHGIGLHIVKGIVEAYEGQLSIESPYKAKNDKTVNGSKMVGTRFIVDLN